MDIMLYLEPFLTALIVTALFLMALISLPFFQQPCFRRTEKRGQGSRISPLRLGGLAMILGFSITVVLDPHLVVTSEIIGLLVGSGCILIYGLWDDLVPLGWKLQLSVQIGLGVLMFFYGVRILSLTHPWGGAWFFPANEFHLVAFLLLIVWLVLVMNSMNWLDGLDSLSGGVTLISMVTIFSLSLKAEVNQPPLAILAAIGAGTVLAFLFFNFHPAKIVAGTAGAVFMGFLVAMLAVLAGTKIATALLVLALPVGDALYVLFRRYRSGSSLFLPDRRHLHYRLEELGWKESSIALFFFGITACIAIIALVTETAGKMAAIIFSIGAIFALLIFIEHRLEQKKNSSL